MAFCKFSSEYVSKTYTIVDNIFFTRYLPSTPPKVATIYLYGLYLCNNNAQDLNGATLSTFASSLGYTEEEVLDAFRYWEEQGLVRIVNTNPLEIQYLPIRGVNLSNKKYSKDKYYEFNIQAQNILSGRQITPNEYEEYYALMEGFSLPDGRKFSPEALLMIIRYCAEFKGNNIGYRYILTVAQNWAKEGVISTENIEKKLSDYYDANKTILKILSTLGSNKKSSIDEHEMYMRWVQDYGFTDDCILYVAGTIKKGGFERLDKILRSYYEMHLFSEKEIKEYETNKEQLYTLTRNINKLIGVYYDDVDNEIQTYITPWLNKGYSGECLLAISNYCYLKDKRTLSTLNDFINKLYNQGIVSLDAFKQYLGNQDKLDNEIRNILDNIGLKRNVNAQDRDLYRRWVVAWNMPSDVIKYAGSLSADKTAPIAYMSKILSTWHNQNIHTLAQAKEYAIKDTTTAKKDNVLKQQDYTDEDFDSIFDAFKEIEI